MVFPHAFRRQRMLAFGNIFFLESVEVNHGALPPYGLFRPLLRPGDGLSAPFPLNAASEAIMETMKKASPSCFPWGGPLPCIMES